MQIQFDITKNSEGHMTPVNLRLEPSAHQDTNKLHEISCKYGFVENPVVAFVSELKNNNYYYNLYNDKEYSEVLASYKLINELFKPAADQKAEKYSNIFQLFVNLLNKYIQLTQEFHALYEDSDDYEEMLEPDEYDDMLAMDVMEIDAQEEMIIAGMLLDYEVIEEVRRVLKISDFRGRHHGMLVRIILDLATISGNCPKVDEVAHEFVHLAKVTPEYAENLLTEIIEQSPAHINLSASCKNVRDFNRSK